MEGKGWGKIMVGVRLEKMVEADFVRSWTLLLSQGLEDGDHWEMTTGMLAHTASNVLARKLLDSDCDSLLILDSDSDVEKDFLRRLRFYEPGWKYDALQAWYPRRGWPPEGIWFKEDEGGRLHNCIVLDQETTEEVALIGTHAALIRKELFQKMLGKEDPSKYEWFYYPRGEVMTEDAAFSRDARAAGGHLGATSAVSAPHIGHLAIGWETYQEYLQTSGQMDQLHLYDQNIVLLSEYLGIPAPEVMMKMSLGGKHVQAAWEKASPKTPEEIHEFYGKEDSGYLFDLANWNSSLLYAKIVGILRTLPLGKVLVVGTGIGGELDVLRWTRSQVDGFDLPGFLKDFCIKRFEGDDRVRFLESSTLQEALEVEVPKETYDFVVAIDVIEHFTPDEFLVNLRGIDRVLKPGGVLLAHNTWDQQELYPMHTDFSALYNEWLKESGFESLSEISWRKPSEDTR